MREGEDVLRVALEGRIAFYGAVHEAVCDSSLALAKLLHVRSYWKHEPEYPDQTREAEVLFKNALEGREALLGRDHVEAVDARREWADFLMDHNRYKEAEKEYKLILAPYSAMFGPQHSKTSEISYRIGACLQFRRHFSKATDFFKTAQEGFKTAYGRTSKKNPTHKSIIEDAVNLYNMSIKRSKW